MVYFLCSEFYKYYLNKLLFMPTYLKIKIRIKTLLNLLMKKYKFIWVIVSSNLQFIYFNLNIFTNLTHIINIYIFLKINLIKVY